MSGATKTPAAAGLVGKRELLAERLRRAAAQPQQSPLSFAQQRLWFLDQLEPNSALYNIGAVARLAGVIRINALEQALDAIVARHETLRTRFVCSDETPLQVVDPHRRFKLALVQLSNDTEAEKEAETHRLIQAELNRPFCLSTDHLLRATLFELGPEEYRLVLILHHVVADEWSLKVLFKELVTFYTGCLAGQPIRLPALPIQYADFARWQRQWLQKGVLQEQLQYWKKQLSGYPPANELPTDRPRTAAPTFNGRTVTRALGPVLTEGLRELAKRQEATLFMVLLAAFKALVHRYTRQDDLIVCSPVAGRTRVETEELIGFFVNTLALRTSLAGDPSFEQLLARVREVTLGAMAHQDLPFDRLVEELQPERTLTHLPFTKLMFTFQSCMPEQIDLPGARLEFEEVDSDLAKFEITLVLRETSQGLLAKIEYNRDLFDGDTISRLLSHFETLLQGIVATPGRPVSQLPLLTPDGRRRVLIEWNQTATAYPRDRCIHEVFEAQVERAPEATAVVWGRQKMSYGELNSRANQLARFLKQFDIKPDVPVGLCLDRSPGMVVGTLGILKAGGAYVPLDANYPKERLSFMLEDTQAPVILTQQRLLERLPRTSAKVVCLDADWELVARERRENTGNLTHARHLAYIMYTSGSTGQPKGVAVPHRAVNRLVLNNNYIRLQPSDRIAQVSNISFDAATFEVWGALLNGAQVVGITRDVALSPRDFADELREQGITAMFLTSALFNQLAGDAPGAFETLRTVIAGGEALDPKWVRAVLRDRPPQRLVNGYGPTENTTFTCCHPIARLGDEVVNVPIGRPISNTTVYVLDSHLNPMPIGVPGELFTGGDGLARGYWNQPELTAEKFIANPFDETESSCLYRTGDLARYLADGTVEFLGRIDGQVKIRGYRIELGEIETLLGRHPAIRDCVVTVSGTNSVNKRLIAYVVPASESVPNASELRGFLLEKLPDYMIPSAFVTLHALPLTPNGKIDRKALPAPDEARPSLDRQYVAPRDATELQLASIWETVLGVRPIGIQDKFFDLGGHSMLAVRVIAQIEKTLGKKLRLATLFQAPTIERLAAVLREEIKESSVTAGTSLVEIQAEGSRPPLFLVHGAGGGMFWGYINLARCLGTEQPVYGFKSRGLDGHEEFGRIEEIAAHYIADLRRVQPHGPYYLGGYCFGGNVAYEMACQLTEQGEKMALLAVLNCAPPNSRYAQIPWTPGWALRFARNLLYWAGYFGHWSATQRREFFRWKWKLIKKRFGKGRRGIRSDLSKVEPGDLVDLSSYTDEQKVIWETHIRALMNFRPRPYQGTIHLFRSPGHPLWCSFDEDYGWGELAREGVELITVSGAHEKILEEPWVKALAEKMSTALRQAQPQRRDSQSSESGSARWSACPTCAPVESSMVTTHLSEAVDAVPKSDLAANAPLRPAVLQTDLLAGEIPALPDDLLDTPYPILFTRRSGRHLSRVAVRFQDQELSYADLGKEANRLAHFLRGLGVRSEALVAVALERSIQLPVALLGVLKAGGAYLSLDPDYPRERLAYMLQDSNPAVLLTQSKLLSRVGGQSIHTICLDDPDRQASISRCSESDPALLAKANNLAYVIYTSGSSGVPKGVQIAHRSLSNHNLAIIEAYKLQPSDRVLQFTPLSFDISVEEIFPTWLSGSTLILRPEGLISSVGRFLEFVASEQVTVLNLPTAYWHELVEFLHATGARLPRALRLVVIGGEKASDEAYRRWKQCVQGAVTLLNGYGATEATITSTLYQAGLEDDTLPIGRPIANTQTIVLDEQLHPVPDGTPGELCIGGAGLARGYLNRPELTAQAFIPNPFPSRIRSERLYKTGDVVRTRPDGNLEFVGRRDDQVKIRGYRIELGEIEAVLRTHSGVKEAALIAREEASGNKRVVASYVPRHPPGPSVSDILKLLKQRLPDYMLPSMLIPLQALPLTPAGKIDRRALPAPGNARPNFGHEFAPATTPIEEQLAQIWKEVLELSEVGVHDNFVELGGHSLLATKALSRIREGLHLDLSLADFFARPTIALLAQHLAELARPSQSFAGDLAPKEGAPLALSSLQERIWFLDQLDPKRTAYNRGVVVQLGGMLSLEALQRSLTELARRHEALRAVFPAENGRPNQILTSPDQLQLKIVDLRQSPDSDRRRQASDLAAREASRPYILSEAVLRGLLLRLGDAEHWLVLVLNEIGVDEGSLRQVLSELPSLYEAFASSKAPAFPARTLRYSETVASLGVAAGAESEQLDYWQRRLKDAPELLDLPADRPRPAQGDYAGARHPFSAPPKVARGIEQLAADQKCEVFPVFLAALAAVLQRYTDNTDIVIGSATSRRSPDSLPGVGAFENPVALRCDLSGDPAFRKLISRLAGTAQEALAHSAVPFGKVVAAVRPQKSASYTPIFQVFLSVGPEPLPATLAGGLSFCPFEIDNQTSKFDLSLRLVKNTDGFSGWIEYSTALFDGARISRLADHLETLLECATNDPDRPLSKLELLPEHETKRLLVEWTATEADYPHDKTLAGLFREQTLRTPKAEALVCGGARLTYSQLYARATQVGCRLRSMGVTNESLVGICLERCPDMVSAILGTLLAGGAYVPLDPKYPKDRLAFVLQDAKVKVLLTQSKLQASLPPANSAVLCLDTLENSPADVPTDPLASRVRPEDLAYVIYTSGSTGKPKGVALEHRNAVAFVSWAKETFTAEELFGVLASTSICFDLSVFELFVPLSWGGKIILAENALALPTLPTAGEVRLINTVPSALRELLRLRAVPSGVQVINLAGEPLSTELVDQIYRETPVRKVFDLYGPTETTTYSTGGLRKAGEPATIGRPLTNEQVYLLDACLRPVPIGVPGELLIGGVGLARGYLNRPDLTAERFIAHPFKHDARLYRTGDLARWRADGNLEYLGRMDHQVKIRGFRIELGEVEAVLKSHPGVGAVVAMAREDQPGDKRLVAYIEPRAGLSLTPEDLKKRSREQLPDFMAPSDFVFLKALPMTPNGKIDRKALPAPDSQSAAARTDLVAARTPIEKQLAAIWCEVLRLKQVGVHDNFFDLGGHSLLAVRVISAIRDTFNLELPLSALFSAPTIAGLSEVLSGLPLPDGQGATSPIKPVPRAGRLPVSYVQERLWFLDQLGPGSAAYNVPTSLRLRGALDIGALRKAVNEIVSRHEALRTTFQYDEGGLTQVIAEHLSIDIPCVDLRTEPAQNCEKRAQELINREARQPFDLTAGPLIRTNLFRLDERDHVLLVVMHHTISDGWSLALFFQELGTAYDCLTTRRGAAQLGSVPVHYVDFAHWQRQWMRGAVLERELAYWKKALEGAPTELALPLDHPRPDRPSGRADSRMTRLGAASVQSLMDFARREGCTPFMVFLTGLMITLRKWTGQEDLIVGTVVAGRTRRELENILGCFMNFLPLRAKMGDDDAGSDVLARVRAAVLDGQSHQDCPFEKIVEAVNPQRRLNGNPLYSVALLLQNFPPNLFQTESLQASSMPVSLEAALLDLRFEIEQAQDGLSLTCEYKTDLFEPGTIEDFLSSWCKVVETLAHSPETRLPAFELSSGFRIKTNTPGPSSKETIAIAATFTADPVRDSLEFWLPRLELPATLEFAPYNQVFQQLLDPASLIAKNRHGLNVILARLEDWQSAEISTGQASTASFEQSIERSATQFLRAIRAAAARESAPFLVCFCPPSLGLIAKPAQAECLRGIQKRIEEELGDIAGVYPLTGQELAERYPVADYYDSAGEELGHVPYTPLFFTALGTALARKFRALNRSAYKVIALDCDNTLWGGVCGEEGPKGIQLDGPRRLLQEFMRTQRESGMLLCLCSKNNEEDVRAVFAERTEMPLGLKDLTATRLNWRPKSENLKSLAKELGLGLDSFIFVDDNPVECAEVEANCPEVLTLQLPENPALLPKFLNHCWAFDHLKLTAEDRQRAELYQQNRIREKLRVEAPTLEDFLASLELQVAIEPICPDHWPRVAQLTQRTNQFNFTTQRWTESELGLRLNTAEGLIVKVSDRFGDYGLVGVVLYQAGAESLVVNNVLLSCRVLGRGIEHRILARLGEIALEKGARWLDVHFVPTAKNKPALDFLDQIGGAFKQPLNGGSVFRLPADFAASVAFHPSSETGEARAAVIVEPTGPSGSRHAQPRRGFSRCREIALEANEAAHIHEEIRKSASVRRREQPNFVAPKNQLERQLCELWQELLHVQPVGVQDDFFQLGGHSLLAVRLFAEIEKIVGRKFPLVTLFQAPTIAQLAGVLTQSDGAGSLLVPIQPRGTKPPLFLIHGAGGDVLWGYANLATHLAPDQPIYGIKSHSQEGHQDGQQLEEMARSYVEVVRARQPEGPYYLGGYCFGGNVAYEMARQLRMQGQPVALVVLLDSAPANAGYETITWWRPGFPWRFARNLRYWLADFLALEPNERHRFFGRKLRSLGRKLKRRFGFQSGQAPFDLEEIIDPRHFPEHELKLWQLHLEALIAHVERPYSGRVALLRTRGQPLFCSLEGDFCWGKLVQEGVVVRCIPGSHENIFMEPNVRVLASELAGLLEEARNPNSKGQSPVSCSVGRESAPSV